MPKQDLSTPTGRRALETIAASTERVRTLRAEGSADAASALATETLLLIADLSGRGSIKARQAASAELTKAEETPLAGTLADADDFHTYAGVPELVDKAAASAKEGVALGVRMATIAREIAETTVAIRLCIPGRGGLPDLGAKSVPYRGAVVALYRSLETGSGSGGDHETALAALKRAVQHQAQKKVEEFLSALDDSEESDVRAYFPQLPPGAPAEGWTKAVMDLYTAEGVHLPVRLTRVGVAGQAPAELGPVGDARAILEKAVRDGSKLPPAERDKLRQDLTAMATALIAEAAKLAEPTAAERTRERATTRVSAALEDLSEDLPADSLDAFQEAAQQALTDLGEVSEAHLRHADWEALYGAYTAA